MKKTITAASIVLILVLLVFCLIMEIRYQGTALAVSDLSEEEVLKEMPDIAISHKDLEMEQYILNLPEVQAKLDEVRYNQTDELAFISFTPAETEILLKNYIPEGYEVTELAVFRNAIYFTFIKGEKESVVYAVSPDGESALQKTIGIYKGSSTRRTCTACYTNDLLGIRKMVPKHIWFGWLKELKKES